jgi:hypothetical protein
MESTFRLRTLAVGLAAVFAVLWAVRAPLKEGWAPLLLDPGGGAADEPPAAAPSWRRRTAQQLLDKWESVPGAHPLCSPAYLEEEVRSLPRAPPPGEEEASAARLSIAGLTVFVRHPAQIRGAMTSNVTKMLNKMRDTWPTQERYFLLPFAMDHLFLFSAGTGLDCALLAVFADLGWTLDARRVQKCSEDNDDGVADASGVYRSALGTRIIVRGRAFPLPRYLAANMDVLQNNEWLNCGVKRDLSYVLSLTAYVHHVLDEPALDAYGAYARLDLDAMFVQQPPADPRKLMQTCALAYLSFYPFETCNTGAKQALEQFSQLTAQPIASIESPWFQEGVFFNDLVYLVRTSLVLSPANIILRTWLYECVEQGYFRHRWVEHAVVPLYLAMWENVGDVEDAANVCDLRSWFALESADKSIVHSEWYSSMKDFEAR